jgi:hypothetical protein
MLRLNLRMHPPLNKTKATQDQHRLCKRICVTDVDENADGIAKRSKRHKIRKQCSSRIFAQFVPTYTRI